MEALRTCKECGLEAFTRDDLEEFKKRKAGKYGRDNICKECFNKTRGDRTKERKQKLAKRYNLTLGEYLEYFKDASCGICGTTDELCLDHNHDTGDVRGVLCRKCNAGLGFLQDSIPNLQNGIKWLEERGSYGVS